MTTVDDLLADLLGDDDGTGVSAAVQTVDLSRQACHHQRNSTALLHNA
jgi:hypothetical protein